MFCNWGREKKAKTLAKTCKIPLKRLHLSVKVKEIAPEGTSRTFRCIVIIQVITEPRKSLGTLEKISFELKVYK